MFPTIRPSIRRRLQSSLNEALSEIELESGMWVEAPDIALQPAPSPCCAPNPHLSYQTLTEQPRQKTGQLASKLSRIAEVGLALADTMHSPIVETLPSSLR